MHSDTIHVYIVVPRAFIFDFWSDTGLDFSWKNQGQITAQRKHICQ